MDIQSLLNEEIRNEFQDLKSMELGSEEYKATVDGLTKLVDRSIEIEKIDVESQEKQIQMKEEKIDRWVKNGIAVGGIILPIVITIWGTKKSFEFEKEGTITTIMGRGFINKLLPKK